MIPRAGDRFRLLLLSPRRNISWVLQAFRLVLQGSFYIRRLEIPAAIALRKRKLRTFSLKWGWHPTPYNIYKANNDKLPIENVFFWPETLTINFR